MNLKSVVLYAFLSRFYSVCASCMKPQPRLYYLFISDPLKDKIIMEGSQCKNCIRKYYKIVPNVSKMVE